MMRRLGGRKAAITILGILCVTLLALLAQDSTATGSIALMVGAFVSGNAFVEGRHAGKPDA